MRDGLMENVLFGVSGVQFQITDCSICVYGLIMSQTSIRHMKHLWIGFICLVLLWAQVMAAPKRVARRARKPAAAASEDPVLTQESIEAKRTTNLARNQRKLASCLQEVRLLEIELRRQKSEAEAIWKPIEQRLQRQKSKCQEDRKKRSRRTAYQYQREMASLGIPVESMEQQSIVEEETEEDRRVKAEMTALNAQISAIKSQIIAENKRSREHLEAERERFTREQEEMRAANTRLEIEIADQARARSAEQQQLNQARRQVQLLEAQLHAKQIQTNQKHAQEAAQKAKQVQLKNEVVQPKRQNQQKKSILARKRSTRQAEELELAQLQRRKVQLTQQLENDDLFLQAAVGSFDRINHLIAQIKGKEERQRNQYQAMLAAQRTKANQQKAKVVRAQTQLTELNVEIQRISSQKQQIAKEMLKPLQDLRECKALTVTSRQHRPEVIPQTSL